jgi:hypothetical protein
MLKPHSPRIDRVDVVVVVAVLLFVVFRGLIPAVASGAYDHVAMLSGSIAVTVLAMVVPSRSKRPVSTGK